MATNNVSIVYTAIDKVSKSAKSMISTLTKLEDTMQSTVKASDRANRAHNKLSPSIVRASESADAYTKILKKQETAIKNISDVTSNRFNQAMKRSKELSKQAGAEVSKMSSEVNKAAKSNKASLDKLTGSLTDSQEARRKWLIEQRKAISAQQDAVEAIIKENKAIDDYIDRQSGAKKALEDAKEAKRKATKADKDYIKAWEAGERLQEKWRKKAAKEQSALDAAENARKEALFQKQLNRDWKQLQSNLQLVKSYTAASKDMESSLRLITQAADENTRSVRRNANEVSNLSNLYGKDFVSAQNRAAASLDMTKARNDELISSARSMRENYLSMNDGLSDNISAHRELRAHINGNVASLSQLISSLQGSNLALRTTRKDLDNIEPALKKSAFSMENLTMHARNFTKNQPAISKAMRAVADTSFFRNGVIAGLNFFEMQYKILGILPLVTVAIGGLSAAMGSLGAGAFAVVGSLSRLAGALAILPGLYAAVGAGALGMKNIMSGWIQPAVTGAAQLKILDQQLADANAKANAASKKVKAATTSTTKTFGQASTQTSGMRATDTKGTKDKALKSELASQQQIARIEAQRKLLLDKMPPRWAEINDAVLELKKNYKNLWQGGERGQVTAQAILDVIKQLNIAVKSDELKSIVARYAQLYAYIADLLKSINTPKNRQALADLWIGAIDNLQKLLGFIKVLGPYFNAFMTQVNWFTSTVLTTLTKKVDGAKYSAKDFGKSMHSFLQRSLRSWGHLWAIIKNLASAFGIISKKTGDIEKGGDFITRFEKGAEGVSAQFKKWAQHLKASDVRKYFDGSTKILKSMGRVLLKVVQAIGGMAANKKAVASTVKFFNLLGTAIGRFGKYMAKAVGGGLGDKMTNFVSNLLDSFKGKGAGLNRAIGNVIDMMNGLVAVFAAMPPWVMELFVTLNLGAMALGYTLGALISPLLKVGGAVEYIAKKFGLVKTSAQLAEETVKDSSILKLTDRGKAAPKALARGVRSQGSAMGGQIKAGAQSLHSGAKDTAFAKEYAMSREQLGYGPNKGSRTLSTIRGTGAQVKRAATAPKRALQAGRAAGLASKAEGAGKIAQTGEAVLGVAKSFKTLSAIPKIVLGISKAFGPVGLVITAVMGIVDALMSNFGGVRDRLVATFKIVGGPLIKAFKDFGSALGLGGGGKGGLISDLMKALDWISKVIGFVLVENFRHMMAGIVPVFTYLINTITNVIELFDGVYRAIKKIFSGDVKGGFKDLAGAAMTFVDNAIGNVISMFKQMFEGMFAGLEDFFIITVLGGLNDAIDAIPGVGKVKAISDIVNDRKALIKERERQAKLEEDLQRIRKTEVADNKKLAEQYGSKEAIQAKIAQNEKTIAKISATPGGRNRGRDAIASLREENSHLSDAKGYAKSAAPKDQAAATSGVTDASNMTGVVTSKKGQPAQVKWDMKSVGTFIGVMDQMRKNLKVLRDKIKETVNYIYTYPASQFKIIKGEWELIGTAMGEGIQKGLHDALHNMETELNKALGAMNASPVDFSKGKSQTSRVTSASSGGSSPTGDSVTGSGVAGPSSSSIGSIASSVATTKGMGDIWNGHPALSGAIGDFVAKGVQMGLNVGATSDHKKYTSSGNISNHFYKRAVDMSSKDTGVMNAFYNALVPYAKSGQIDELIHNNDEYKHGQYMRYGGTGHYDHVHFATPAGGAAAGGLSMDQMAAYALSDPGIIGKGALGGIATAAGQAAYAAATSMTSGLVSSAGGEGGSYAGDHSGLDQGSPAIAKSYARSVLGKYGWGPEQMDPLIQMWNDESGWRWNADNPSSDAYGIPQSLPGSKMASMGADWATNVGTQVDWGLWYLKQGAQTSKSLPGGGYGSPSQALIAKNSTSPAWYGDGGSFTAKKPMLIGVGDKQPEEVRVTPTRGPNKGKHGGGKTTVINSSVHLGTLIANEAGIEALTEEIGKQIRRDIKTAQDHTLHDED